MLNISGIEKGYVIDHIKSGMAMRIYELLGLDDYDGVVAIIKNAKSRKYGKKDMVKIEGLADLNLDFLGFLDDSITINVVENGKIIEKKSVSLPEKITGYAKCKNPRCITTIEPGLKQVFLLSDREKRVYRCRYCEEELSLQGGKL